MSERVSPFWWVGIVRFLHFQNLNDINSVVRCLSVEYRLSPLVIKDILNGYLRYKDKSIHIDSESSLRFAEIVSENVSLDDLLEALQYDRPQRKQEKEISPQTIIPTQKDNRWKNSYDKLEKQFLDLKADYEELLSSSQVLSAENKKLKDILKFNR